LKDVIGQVETIVEEHDKKMKNFNHQSDTNHGKYNDYCSESDSAGENEMDNSDNFIIEEYLMQ